MRNQQTLKRSDVSSVKAHVGWRFFNECLELHSYLASIQVRAQLKVTRTVLRMMMQLSSKNAQRPHRRFEGHGGD